MNKCESVALPRIAGRLQIHYYNYKSSANGICIAKMVNLAEIVTKFG